MGCYLALSFFPSERNDILTCLSKDFKICYAYFCGYWNVSDECHHNQSKYKVLKSLTLVVPYTEVKIHLKTFWNRQRNGWAFLPDISFNPGKWVLKEA